MSTPNPQYPVPQAGRMPNSMVNTPMKSSNRRILGDLTPNAKVASSKHHVSGDLKPKTMENTSPLKQQQVAPTASMTSPAVIAGKKRSFEEVNGTRGGETAQKTPMSKRYTERDAPSVEKQRRRAAAHALASTTSRLVELPEDLSSTDEDTIGPTGLASQETTATKASFSSLIDYNPAEASDRSRRPSSSPPNIENTAALSHAETLRLRLRMAMYKVSTNQTRVPLARLRIAPRAPAPPPSLSQQISHIKAATSAKAPATSAPSQTAPPAFVHPSAAVPSIVVSSAAAPTSTATSTSNAAIPKLLPAPVLLPTAYSSRFVAAPYWPSSPPGLTGATVYMETSPAEDNEETPRQARSGREMETPLARRMGAGAGAESPVHHAGSSGSLSSEASVGSGTTVSLGLDGMDERGVREAVEGRRGVGMRAG